ncbi:hypothetical protein Sme01_49970 [Sphaerisporangium melleum]|uniref:Uncharacterized protein n=1 Tax=Sphaerisporangium melleum TaxID=321316 RepID=A0A917VIZ8_9ACTN|nr:hypothetical protein [Sphaerisporangium melleum]GGK89611.1 hypothetical protein GCM10007964_35380 [Sphaerisporangium melleum]GII72521.1 hypothetical protein Sme01_49970 [Sphaerisporangium melleum]
MSAQERRLSAIGEAAAGVLRTTPYHLARAEEVAAAVRLPREGHTGRRSAVWLYNEVKSRRVLVALALHHAFAEFAERNEPADRPAVPGGLVEARELVTRALLLVARFHRAESFLTQQVQLGIGDIATSEKRQSAPHDPPAWPESAIGRAASAGWAGRVLAYACHLAPVLSAAAQAVCPPPRGWAQACAEQLSDLAFDALTDDCDGPVDRQAAALSAHWYERHLVPLAGSWVAELDVAERVRDTARRTAPGGRAEIDAQAQVLRCVLDTGILLRRAGREAADLARLLAASGEQDPRALFDVHSRRGLALLRYGDLEGTRASFATCRELAEKDLAARAAPEAAVYRSRARHNLGELMLEAGRPVEAAEQFEPARIARAEGAGPASGVSPAWRRHTLTAQAAARAVARAGRVVEGLRQAEAVVADRLARLGEPGDINVIAARVSLAETLLEAGQPIEARHLLQEARRHRAELVQPIAYWTGYDTVRLAQVELALREPVGVLRLLDDAPVMDAWFARHVSCRLWAEARTVHAMATALAGDIGAARAALGELAAAPHAAPAETHTAAVARALAEVELMSGDPAAAAAELTKVQAAERMPGDPPGRARTLLLTARCEEARGDAAAARRHREALAGLTHAGVDPLHPLLLEGRFDEAARRFHAGSFEGLEELLAPLLDRTPLAHGRPALGDGHPLLLKAVVLADRSGAVHLPRTPRQILWEDA